MLPFSDYEVIPFYTSYIGIFLRNIVTIILDIRLMLSFVVAITWMFILLWHGNLVCMLDTWNALKYVITAII